MKGNSRSYFDNVALGLLTAGEDQWPDKPGDTKNGRGDCPCRSS
jgi:hypothetical protein